MSESVSGSRSAGEHRKIDSRPDLATFQAEFAWAILDQRQSGRLAAQPGFAVYRNTSFKAAIETLGANFPTVEALLGTEVFAAIALANARENRPASPIMCDYDASFPDFLAQSPLADDLPYLADVARIDWLWSEVYFAADADPIHPAVLSNPSDSRLARIALAPASRHAWLETPAVTIWLAHQGEVFGELDLAWRAEGVHVTRLGGAVSVDCVDAATICFLDALGSGEMLVTAATTLLSRHPDADLPSIIARLLERGALILPDQSGALNDRG